MQFKTFFLSIFSFLLVTLSPSIWALDFAFDNYTDATTLSYSYSLNGHDWKWAGYIPATKQSPLGYIVFDFINDIPLSWKIAATNGKELHCVDYVTKKPTANVITLNKPIYTRMDNLLLDVLTINDNRFMASIIDVDGESSYSNALECSVVDSLGKI